MCLLVCYRKGMQGCLLYRLKYAVIIYVIIISMMSIFFGCSTENSIHFGVCLEECIGDHCDESLEDADRAELETCTIVVGGSGYSQEITHTFSSQDSYSVNTCEAWSFIRSTSGNCRFTVYEQSDLTGRYVTLGTGLQARIRAGENGIRYKDKGGPGTWKIRSIKIEPVTDTACHVNIGGKGIRMNYFPGEYDFVPAMDRLTYFFGGNCTAHIYNDSEFGVYDFYNRFKSIRTNTTDVSEGESRKVYCPGFRARSMKIFDWKSTNCSLLTSVNMDFGRCLPSTLLDESIFTDDAARDLDHDGLADYYEDILADEFRPIILNDSGENATRTDAYMDSEGNTVIEPVTVFQVRKDGTAPDRLRIVYMQLWWMDVEQSYFCSGHYGDSQYTSIVLRTVPNASESMFGRFWYVYATDATDKPSKSRLSNRNMNLEYVGEDESAEDENLLQGDADDETLLTESVWEQEHNERTEPPPSDAFSDDESLENDHYDMLSAYEKDTDLAQSFEETEYKRQLRIMAGEKVKYDFTWQQGDNHIRGPIFESVDGQSLSDMKHVVYYFSKGKHHYYQDTGWSGGTEKYCVNLTGHVDGRGELQFPPLPRRALSIRAALGAGDPYGYTNVGSRDHYSGFTNSLLDLGFPYYRVWADKCFRSEGARSINRVFFCSNNINRECCLEDEPDCKVRSVWACE